MEGAIFVSQSVDPRDSCTQQTNAKGGGRALLVRFVSANVLTRRLATRETSANASRRDVWSLSKVSTVCRLACRKPERGFVRNAKITISASTGQRLRREQEELWLFKERLSPNDGRTLVVPAIPRWALCDVQCCLAHAAEMWQR